MATWLSGISKQLRTLRKNIFLWCCLYLLAFAGIFGRVLWLQTIKQPFYHRKADEYHLRTVTLPATRGRLYDRNLRVLALDDQRLSLFADPTLLPDRKDDPTRRYTHFVAGQLAAALGKPEAKLFADLEHIMPYVWVKRGFDHATAQRVRALALPGLAVTDDPQRYHVRVAVAQLPAEPEALQTVSRALAKALGLSAKSLRKQLGILQEPEKAKGKTDQPVDGEAPVITPANAPIAASAQAGALVRLPPPPVLLEDTVTALRKAEVEKLHLAGVTFEALPRTYSLKVFPPVYLADHPPVDAETAAGLLAPVLGRSARAVEDALLSRTRFVWLKRGLPEATVRAITQRQGTMYVVEPGKILDPTTYRDENTSREEKVDPQEEFTEAVERLYSMLNDLKKGETQAHNEVISRDEIRRRLVPGAAPGPLGVKLVDGKPSKRVARRLYAKPIPGVVYGLPGINFQQERRRRYPFGKLASPTLGFVGEMNGTLAGAFGLEFTQNETLAGVDGVETKEIDARNLTIPERSTQKLPVDGRHVVLTLDVDIQQVAEAALDQAVQETRAIGGQCIVMDVESGEILALASAPRWDANNPGQSELPLEQRVKLVNQPISNIYEPGSTFKTFTVVAALEEGIARDKQTVTYCSGALPVSNHVIHEAHNAHGAVDVDRLLEQSCNIGAAVLAMKLGPQHFTNWCEKFGFGQTTGIELPQESRGSLNKEVVRKAKITLANQGFGQSIAVTPLQMVAGYAAVANGGVYVQPHLVKGRVQPDGSRAYITAPSHRVCSPETSKLLLSYLEHVVTEGTGKSAAIPGYRVGGKTGTAQKAVTGGGGYGSGKAIGSFISVMPINKPKLAIICAIDEPQSSHYGGVVAAPVVHTVGQRALQFLGIPPTEPVAKPRRR